MKQNFWPLGSIFPPKSRMMQYGGGRRKNVCSVCAKGISGGVLWKGGEAAHEELEHPLSAHRECHSSHCSWSLAGAVLDP